MTKMNSQRNIGILTLNDVRLGMRGNEYALYDISINTQLKTSDTGTEHIYRNWDTLKPVHAGAPVFSMSARIYGKDSLSGAWCYDELESLIEKYGDPVIHSFRKIRKFWHDYDCNSMHAGTKAQEEFLEKAGAMKNSYSFEKACELLKEAGLYEDRGYRYGSNWLYRPFSPSVFRTAVKLGLLTE